MNQRRSYSGADAGDFREKPAAPGAQTPAGMPSPADRRTRLTGSMPGGAKPAPKADAPGGSGRGSTRRPVRDASFAAGGFPGAARAPYAGEGRMPGSFAEFVRMNARGIASVVVTAAVIVAVLVGIRSCAGGAGESADSTADSASTASASASATASSYRSPYTWSNLSRANGRYTYAVDGTVVSRLGVDVSENQGWIDWNAVAGDGIDFAIVRCGYRGSQSGEIYGDAYFDYNLQNAQAAGLDTGVYFFSQANTTEEAQAEADYVISQLNGRSLVYPVVFDSENNAAGVGSGRTANLSKTQMTNIAEAFCARIEQAGYRAMTYGNGTDMARYSVSDLEQYPVWWAEYGQPYPTAQMDFTMWQYTNEGSVAGVSTAVDLSIDLSGALS